MTVKTATVAAEDAPLGVQLWPTIAARYGANFTLAEVRIITTEIRTRSGVEKFQTVEWVYENGKTRRFSPGEQVAVDAAAVAK